MLICQENVKEWSNFEQKKMDNRQEEKCIVKIRIQLDILKSEKREYDELLQI